MRKAWILLILGIWLAALPYLGFPYSWKDVLTSLSGFVLIFLSFLIYRDYKQKGNREAGKKTYDNFRENNDFIDVKSGSKTIRSQNSAENA